MACAVTEKKHYTEENAMFTQIPFILADVIEPAPFIPSGISGGAKAAIAVICSVILTAIIVFIRKLK